MPIYDCQDGVSKEKGLVAVESQSIFCRDSLRAGDVIPTEQSCRLRDKFLYLDLFVSFKS